MEPQRILGAVELTECAGCEDDPHDEDHCHWFTNFFGIRERVYKIDGKVFNFAGAIRHVRYELECALSEAKEYIESLPVYREKG